MKPFTEPTRPKPTIRNPELLSKAVREGLKYLDKHIKQLEH